MAVAPIPPSVTVDEYLNSSYRPDLEFVDGVLIERAMPTDPHSLLQVIVAAWFYMLRKKFGFAVMTERRTEIVPRARYRIPDVMLCAAPVSRNKALRIVPWAVIEITSPDDRWSEQLDRLGEFQQIGVRHIILLDPEKCIAFRFDDGSLLQTKFTSLDLPTGSVPFDTEALFRELQEQLE
jgi:Uma2 family endonuclease